MCKELELLRNIHEELREILVEYGSDTIIASRDNDIEIVLHKQLDVNALADILRKLADGLRKKGWRVVGARLELSEGTWRARIFVVLDLGKIVSITIANPTQQSSTQSIYEESPTLSTQHRSIPIEGLRWRTGLEERERLLEAAAMYFVEEAPEEIVMKRLEELVGRENG